MIGGLGNLSMDTPRKAPNNPGNTRLIRSFQEEAGDTGCETKVFEARWTRRPRFDDTPMAWPISAVLAGPLPGPGLLEHSLKVAPGVARSRQDSRWLGPLKSARRFGGSPLTRENSRDFRRLAFEVYSLPPGFCHFPGRAAT